MIKAADSDCRDQEGHAGDIRKPLSTDGPRRQESGGSYTYKIPTYDSKRIHIETGPEHARGIIEW